MGDRALAGVVRTALVRGRPTKVGLTPYPHNARVRERIEAGDESIADLLIDDLEERIARWSEH